MPWPHRALRTGWLGTRYSRTTTSSSWGDGADLHTRCVDRRRDEQRTAEDHLGQHADPRGVVDDEVLLFVVLHQLPVPVFGDEVAAVAGPFGLNAGSSLGDVRHGVVLEQGNIRHRQPCGGGTQDRPDAEPLGPLDRKHQVQGVERSSGKLAGSGGGRPSPAHPPAWHRVSVQPAQRPQGRRPLSTAPTGARQMAIVRNLQFELTVVASPAQPGRHS
ncbi:MAG: hypothetical protein WCG47_21620 [Dermatophilaceae bacterium]